MVRFDRANHTFTITIRGGESEYFNMLRSLTRVISGNADKESLEHVANLLEDMLPAPEQEVLVMIEKSTG